MKAYVVRGPGRMEMADVPMPVPGPEQVLVRVAYCSVCGSDIMALEGRGLEAPPGMILGHEVSGTVAGVGERVSGLRVGDRVALEPAIPCRRCWLCQRGQYHMCANTVHLGTSTPGGYAEYLAIHELNAHRLPHDLPLREAALLEVFGVCLAGLRRGRLSVGETVAVFGDGPFGAAFAHLGVIMGASQVWVLGHHDWRLERIRAPHVHVANTLREACLDALLESTGGRGADLAVVATPAPGVYGELLPAVRIQGRILAFSFPSGPVTFDMSRVHMRELEIIGACRCPHTYETLLDLIAQRRLDPGELITEVLPLEELPRAFALARGSSKELFKIVIRLSDEL